MLVIINLRTVLNKGSPGKKCQVNKSFQNNISVKLGENDVVLLFFI